MSLEYTVTYCTENTYESDVSRAFWQFCIIPQNNDSQTLVSWSFQNSLRAWEEISINGFGFDVIRLHPKKAFKEITFKARFKLIKEEINPFDFILNLEISEDYATLADIGFRTDYEPYLRKTHFTTLSPKHRLLYPFDPSKKIFDNLLHLNGWVFEHLFFKVGVTDVHTTLDEIIEKRHGVCQDFTHLFCAIARENNVPVRYVSGYLHQGIGFFGASQMHAWVEAFVPKVGWVGFDPTNNILVGHDHVKVAHGKDYHDCPPIKGIVYSEGQNTTKYTVEVQAAQQQQ